MRTIVRLGDLIKGGSSFAKIVNSCYQFFEISKLKFISKQISNKIQGTDYHALKYK